MIGMTIGLELEKVVLIIRQCYEPPKELVYVAFVLRFSACM